VLPGGGITARQVPERESEAVAEVTEIVSNPRNRVGEERELVHLEDDQPELRPERAVLAQDGFGQRDVHPGEGHDAGGSLERGRPDPGVHVRRTDEEDLRVAALPVLVHREIGQRARRHPRDPRGAERDDADPGPTPRTGSR
jgi:hypothetical protein